MNPLPEINESDLHAHLKARMLQRGVSLKEINETLHGGWSAGDAVEGTFGKVQVFTYNSVWEGKNFEEKEVTVYYKYRGEQFILLTVKTRYGKNFKKEEIDEN